MSAPDVDVMIQDPRRLSVVVQSGLLDSPPEDCFDRLTQLAAKVLKVPIAYISISGDARDYYKSAYGLTDEDDRELLGRTVSRKTMVSDGAMVIDDTGADPNLAADLRRRGFGSCLGARLTVSGEVVGSFCAIAREPRRWSTTDIEVLEQLARSAVREVELRVALRKAEEKAAETNEERRQAVEMSRLSEGVARLENEPRDAKASAHARVLVVEDDPAMRRLIVRTIAREGLEVAEARDGREALDLLEQSGADAMVLDLMLPHVTGWDVLAARANDPKLRAMPVIVVSAKRGPDVARALAFGIYGLVPKPFDPADLRDLVHACVAEQRR